MSTDTQPEMQIPGVRYVKRKIYDVEATTLDGETTYREVARTVRVPAPPRDWDMVLARGLICGAILVTALSVGWSTNSIGGLLARSSSELAAYSVAIIFDVVWLSGQIREWLDRRDPERAKIPRCAGYVALAITMAALVAHGYVEHEIVSGVVGATVSALAKGMWMLVLGYYAVPLDPGMAHHLLTRRRRIAVKLALGAERRQLAALETTERLLYGYQGGDAQVTRHETDMSAPVSPAVPVVSPAPALASLPYVQPAQPAPAPVPAAPTVSPVSPQVTPVPAAPTAPVSAPMWDASSIVEPEVWDEFNGHPVLVGPDDDDPPVPPASHSLGLPVDQFLYAAMKWSPASTPVSPSVPPVPAPPVHPDTAREQVLSALSLPLDTPGAPAPAPAAPEEESGQTARPYLRAVGGKQTKTDFIADAIKANPAITLDDLTDQVRDVYGDKKNLRKDVYRLRHRLKKKAEAS